MAIASEFELLKLIESLFATIVIEDIEYPNNGVRISAIEQICAADTALFSPICCKKILRYMRGSPAYWSADFIEDEFEIDFDSLNAGFEVDYKGGYTFVEDKWLPLEIVNERRYYEKLINFYVSMATREESIFKKFQYVAFPTLRFIDSDFVDFDFRNCVFYKSQYFNTLFEESVYYKVDCRQNVFTNCEFAYVQFIQTKLTDSVFRKCLFTGGQFSQSNLSGSKFEDCEFGELSFFKCDFEDIDLSSNTFEGCLFAHCDLSGQKKLKQKTLNACFGDDTVILPKHLVKPDFWPQQADIGTWDHWLETGEVEESSASVTYK